jgi:hypothetical protein
MSLHNLETWLFEMPNRPMACTKSSTRGGPIGRSEHPSGRAGRATECCSPSLAHPPGSPVPLIPLWRDFQCTRGLGAVNLQCTRIIGLTNLSVTVLPHFSEFALYSPRRFSFNLSGRPTRSQRGVSAI